MRKVILFILLVSTFAINIYAKPRNVSEALNIASNFYKSTIKSQKTYSLGTSPLHLAYTCQPQIITRSDISSLYYIFNKGISDGYIIVSGDDRAKDVLGYSDNGSFNIDSIPDNLRNWLTTYEKELNLIASQTENPIRYPIFKVSTATSPYPSEVLPLLNLIKWNQGYPYNLLCPVINTSTGGRAATGCVATAMAEVMRFHKWPVRGAGANTYMPRGFTTTLNVDFSQSVYDWANMSETYNSLSTTEQNNAVAKLMYDCGVSIDMNYGPSSGAVTTDMANALITNFGYDPNIQYHCRDYYPYSDWINILKKELSASRPILYGGNSTDVGHQFVCDGYNAQDFFHFNWGWGGSSNGYFELSALNPGTLGTGGGNVGGFNYNQDIVIGVQKAGTGTSSPSYVFTLDYPLASSIASMGRTEKTTITVKRMYNSGINTFRGARGVALYNSTGLVKVLSSVNVTECAMYSGWSTTSFSIQVPTTISNGSYKLYCVYKGLDQTDWQIANTPNGIANYLNVLVTDASSTFSLPDACPKLTLNDFSVIGNLYQNKIGRFQVNLTNSNSEYYSVVAVYLVSTTNNTVNQYVVIDPISLAANETKTLNFIGVPTLAPGDYYLYIGYDPLNNRFVSPTATMLNTGKLVKILPTPTEPPSLTLTAQISVPNVLYTDSDLITLTAQIQNTGGYFYDKMTAFIYSKVDNSYVANLDVKRIVFDKNETKSVVFTGHIGLPPNQYIASLNYWDSNTSKWIVLTPEINSSIIFSSIDRSTGIDQTTAEKLFIYPNPAYDEIHFNSQEIVKRVIISDISGKSIVLVRPNVNGEITIPIDYLAKGTYLVQIETTVEHTTCKFIKAK